MIKQFLRDVSQYQYLCVPMLKFNYDIYLYLIKYLYKNVDQN